jgi:hypothetical protein
VKVEMPEEDTFYLAWNLMLRKLFHKLSRKVEPVELEPLVFEGRKTKRLKSQERSQRILIKKMDYLLDLASPEVVVVTEEVPEEVLK